MQLCSDSFGRRKGFFFFLNRLFHNLLAQICCCCTLCFSGSLGPPKINLCLASHLNDPGKWLPWKMLLNAEWIFLPARGGETGSGILSCRGRGLGPGLQLDIVARSFLVFIKILWLSFGIAHWIWLCAGGGCTVLSATHTHQITVALRTRGKLKVENRLTKGSCSAIFVIGALCLQLQSLSVRNS